ncbi:Na+/H+ antiporter NhaC family protein [Pseudoramibacter sp.]|jgi:Na+/H+ antiporter NhaC|uniref:Na+/H+ antiporter NhaC family protein n=1 Tax=Pseudoramibacter sp. TaxID=2034862 RepID=UPI00260093EA|nr:Na+/H+ antiporter NhaC family protein [Pseudoramibacter sp.]MCH4072669.1 Na+/H+ antiporter NhaC family protein [Pseudoramibacter sp.]MCH4106440.1 Na+/H+ antiporter NhaC family protein [Pseudoramibacter sp.]
MFYGTWWSLVPPLVAIILALVTKEVYISLFCGVFLGALFVGNFHIWKAFTVLLNTMVKSIDLKIIIFDVLLGMIVVLMGKSGGTSAYGRWATKKIKNKRQAEVTTSLLGVLIFVDDYFNCLTVGSVMRPVTDKFKVSRAKLAYIIDATAAPVCILAPISSWAAAVNSYVPKGGAINGFQLFVSTIPFNLYAILTLFMVFYTSARGFDFGLMAKHERNAENGDLFTSYADEFKDEMEEEKKNVNRKGKVRDLILPMIVMIGSAIGAMIYTGFLSGSKTVAAAFANCDVETALVFSMLITIVFIAFLYLPRKLVSFSEMMQALPEGAKMMIPAILILTFAWTLKGVTDRLGIGAFFSNSLNLTSTGVAFIPVIIFFIAIFISFSTGTSWGTFSILVPIAISIFNNTNIEMMIITVSAILAGAVCGDHVSPISDTTIMSSAGAQCHHMNHVATQLQYAIPVILSCGIGYVIAGFSRNWWLTLLISLCLLIAVLAFIKRYSGNNGEKITPFERKIEEGNL